MDWIKLEFIQGHAPRTEGEKYGEVTPEAIVSTDDLNAGVAVMKSAQDSA